MTSTTNMTKPHSHHKKRSPTGQIPVGERFLILFFALTGA